MLLGQFRQNSHTFSNENNETTHNLSFFDINICMALSNRYHQALSYAYELHKDQYRKDGKTPYLSHLIAVSALALQFGGTEDEAIAALLHDAVEDQGGIKTLEAIRLRFGDHVAHIVRSCSDHETKPKPPWQERKVEYLKHMAETDESSLLVTCCDKLNNANDCLRTYRKIGTGLWQLFSVPRESTRWYYGEIARVVRERRNEFPRLTFLIDEVIQTIEELLALP
jgi:(p)ppGpp synthase/HD superfamily hydrolase